MHQTEHFKQICEEFISEIGQTNVANLQNNIIDELIRLTERDHRLESKLAVLREEDGPDIKLTLEIVREEACRAAICLTRKFLRELKISHPDTNIPEGRIVEFGEIYANLCIDAQIKLLHLSA